MKSENKLLLLFITAFVIFSLGFKIYIIPDPNTILYRSNNMEDYTINTYVISLFDVVGITHNKNKTRLVDSKRMNQLIIFGQLYRMKEYSMYTIINGDI